MDILEKVEALREKANISYEEAKSVLEIANGDLLDAMVILEKQGKIRRPETEIAAYDSSAENSEAGSAADDRAAGDIHAAADIMRESSKQKAETERKAENCGKKIANVVHVLKDNFLHVTRRENTLFVMPVWVFVLILLVAWKVVIPVMLISLLFRVRYSFRGENDMSSANDFMNKVGDMAEDIVDGLKA